MYSFISYHSFFVFVFVFVFREESLTMLRKQLCLKKKIIIIFLLLLPFSTLGYWLHYYYIINGLILEQEINIFSEICFLNLRIFK